MMVTERISGPLVAVTVTTWSPGVVEPCADNRRTVELALFAERATLEFPSLARGP